MIRIPVVAICDQCKKEVDGSVEQELVGPLGFLGGIGNGPPPQALTTKTSEPWIADFGKIFCSAKCVADYAAAKAKPREATT